jgi:hypothetical protein
MKSIINRVGLLLSVLHLTGTLSTEALQAQTIIPTSHSPTIKTLAQDRVLQSQTTVPPHLNALDQQNVSLRLCRLSSNSGSKNMEIISRQTSPSSQCR